MDTKLMTRAETKKFLDQLLAAYFETHNVNLDASLNHAVTTYGGVKIHDSVRVDYCGIERKWFVKVELAL